MPASTHRLLLVALLACWAPSFALGQGKAAPEEGAGLEVGAEAPEFALEDQAGKRHTLKELLEAGPVALVFYRSAGWCPFCKKQLIQLQKDLGAVRDSGIQIVGISYDEPRVLASFAEKAKIEFPLLSDPESKTIEAYHILNHEAKGKGEGIPLPGTFVIDQKGIIRAKLFLEGYRERHSTEALIEAAKTVKK